MSADADIFDKSFHSDWGIFDPRVSLAWPTVRIVIKTVKVPGK